MSAKGMLASTLVQCHFDYACWMWFSCVSSTSRKRLQIIQNKLIRFILGISTRSHIGYREFSSSNMLPVEYRVTQIKLNHMFNIVHGSAPEYLKNNINITREPAHNTRSGSFACYIPNVKSFGIKSFFFTGSKLWNSLSHSIQCITDKFIFKKMIKGTYGIDFDLPTSLNIFSIVLNVFIIDYWYQYIIYKIQIILAVRIVGN